MWYLLRKTYGKDFIYRNKYNKSTKSYEYRPFNKRENPILVIILHKSI